MASDSSGFPIWMSSHASNLALATFLGATVVYWGTVVNWRPFDMIDFGLYAALTTIIVINVLRRPMPLAQDSRWWVYMVCIVSMFYFIAFEIDESFAEQRSLIAYGAMLLSHLLGCFGSLYLGRSFSVMPARRAIKTGFIYRFVRHPIYALYILADLQFVFSAPTIKNAVVWFTGFALFYWRAVLEEDLLRRDESYVNYMKKTRWRFFPGLM